MNETGNGIDVWRGCVLECAQRPLPLSHATPLRRAMNPPGALVAPRGVDLMRGRASDRLKPALRAGDFKLGVSGGPPVLGAACAFAGEIRLLATERCGDWGRVAERRWS